MVARSRQNIIRKKQFIYLIATLYNNRYKDGLTLHEITYLLTKRQNLNTQSSLEKKFKDISRKDVFTSRQRIHDCLTILKNMNIINKEENKYYLNTMVCNYLLKYEIQINEIHEKSNSIEETLQQDKDFRNYDTRYSTLEKDERNLLKKLIDNYEKINKKT